MEYLQPQPNGEACLEQRHASRIVHLHPTLQCNLACGHCYSGSAPDFREQLELGQVLNFLSLARGEGFDTLSISGGEPFLYKDLHAVFSYSKQLGYTNVLASNGMLLQTRSAEAILGLTDLIAVSIDGKPELHNSIRRQANAFDKTMQGLQRLRDLKKPFGIIHTITAQSWDSLVWLADLAQAQGASLLQLHPLELYGRANSDMQHAALDQMDLHKVFILVEYMKASYEGLSIQLDLLHRNYIETFPETVNVFECQTNIRQLSDYLNVIVVNEKGDVLPTVYGFSDAYKIGNIADFSSEHFRDYMQAPKHRLERLFRMAFDHIIRNEDKDLLNWNEYIVALSKHEDNVNSLAATH